jgi:anti-sigma regulatory factor (Ser/Thr protein kinase)
MTALTVVLPADARSIPAARRALDGLGLVAGDRKDDVRLLVSELVTNSIRHGRLGADQNIELRLSFVEGCIRVEVRDPGIGFRFAPPPPAGSFSRGWGLRLVEKIADRWGTSARGDPQTVVWFEMEIPADDMAGQRVGGDV